MTVSDKIRYFYDTVKINSVFLPQPSKLAMAIAIPAAVVSVLVGAALIIPSVSKKQPAKTAKKPISGRSA